MVKSESNFGKGLCANWDIVMANIGRMIRDRVDTNYWTEAWVLLMCRIIDITEGQIPYTNI